MSNICSFYGSTLFLGMKSVAVSIVEPSQHLVALNIIISFTPEFDIWLWLNRDGLSLLHTEPAQEAPLGVIGSTFKTACSVTGQLVLAIGWQLRDCGPGFSVLVCMNLSTRLLGLLHNIAVGFQDQTCPESQAFLVV